MTLVLVPGMNRLLSLSIKALKKLGTSMSDTLRLMIMTLSLINVFTHITPGTCELLSARILIEASF